MIDTGVGIPKEKWDDDLRSVRPGRQFGDAEVRRHRTGAGDQPPDCRSHGRNAHLQSEVGKGSVFTATIDVTSSPSVPVAGASRPTSSRGARRTRQPRPPRWRRSPRGRVLVVEDGDTNRKLIELILRRAGLEVATAENGKLGVEAALCRAFDLILMDMQMPVMDGYTRRGHSARTA